MTTTEAEDDDNPLIVLVSDKHLELERKLRSSLEFSIEKGKLKPFEVIEIAELYGVRLPAWIEKRNNYYSRGSK